MAAQACANRVPTDITGLHLGGKSYSLTAASILLPVIQTMPNISQVRTHWFIYLLARNRVGLVPSGPLDEGVQSCTACMYLSLHYRTQHATTRCSPSPTFSRSHLCGSTSAAGAVLFISVPKYVAEAMVLPLCGSRLFVPHLFCWRQLVRALTSC